MYIVDMGAVLVVEGVIVIVVVWYATTLGEIHGERGVLFLFIYISQITTVSTLHSQS